MRAEDRADVEFVDEGAAVAPIIQQLDHHVPPCCDRLTDAVDMGRIGLRALEEAAVAPHEFLGRVAREL